MANTLQQYYIDTAAKAIRRFNELKDSGTKVKKACDIVASEIEGMSAGKVNSLIYNKAYPYAKEAWKIIMAENEDENEDQKSVPGVTENCAATGSVVS
ncbi:hypothetical protein [Cochleicola gelatinilyticus]|uniref:Uncharacterized protein n=1 Tax=Cochleicola gelatinilyticus TaxID=1763537 RepID=A0A167IJT9_9FLAO|nr:hypothetical protein [Cochleicola gelatinilyticus]OAB79728.1 hypothetical protein ULVI_03005 [Cochleicola gelatinilyticus]